MTRLTSTPPPSGQSRQPRDQLEEAEQLRQQGKRDRAETICFALTRRYPNYVAAFHTLGLIYLDKRNYERALDCLVRATMLDPKNWIILTALSLTYLRIGASEMAAQTLERALAIRPNDATIFASLGEIYREEREYELAEHAYQRALTLDRDLETAVIGLAVCLSATGQFSKAAAVLEQAFARGHRSLNLLQVMMTLPPNTFGIDLLSALDLLAAGQDKPDAEFRNTFSFARATALDLVGRHEEAWKMFVAANRPLASANLAAVKADVVRREKSLARLRNSSFKIFGPSSIGKEPVSLFILGPSRSGKTSLERLVSVLDGVKAGYENPIVENAIRGTFQKAAIPASPHLDELPPPFLPAFHDNYLEDLVRRVGSARVLTNTISGRIHDAGLIAQTIPNVRFLLVKRNADDTALRIFMTKYLRGNSYAYDLKSIRDYLNWYDAMIDLTAAKLPGIARIVTYEAMITDPATTLQEAADLCGLSMKHDSLPALGNDRGCSAPYREFMGRG